MPNATRTLPVVPTRTLPVVGRKRAPRRNDPRYLWRKMHALGMVIHEVQTTLDRATSPADKQRLERTLRILRQRQMDVGTRYLQATTHRTTPRR